MRTGLAISATLSSIKPLSLNRIDSTRNTGLYTASSWLQDFFEDKLSEGLLPNTS